MPTVDVSLSEGVTWPVERIEAEAALVLGQFGLDHAELSVLLCDDATIQPLNRQYRDKDKPTDVLSFSQVEGEAIGQGEVLGDVVISLETAARQARARRRSLDDEMARLLVHGALHLIGHDHVRAGEARRMRAEERRLLRALRSPGG